LADETLRDALKTVEDKSKECENLREECVLLKDTVHQLTVQHRKSIQRQRQFIAMATDIHVVNLDRDAAQKKVKDLEIQLAEAETEVKSMQENERLRLELQAMHSFIYMLYKYCKH